jgi:acid phosphatase (class A)
VTDAAKNYWQRPRPFLVNTNLVSADPEKSFGYPSGHSTRATVDALLLAELIPDKRDDILAVGRDIGWRRVEGASHYPTDIYAGRVLAQAIVRELKTSPAFQHDFAEVKAEITAARQASNN